MFYISKGYMIVLKSAFGNKEKVRVNERKL